MIPVILAGGKGERFWPLSRQNRPKQFLSLDGSGTTLLQATAERLLSLSDGWPNLWVITSALLGEGVAQQLPYLPAENILAEPQGRDTAPAVGWATLEAVRRYGQDVVLGLFPADHWIEQPDLFQQTIKAAEQLAIAQGAIVTLGVKPNFPSTGYGYIEQGDLAGEYGGFPAYRVARFTEKPDLKTAKEFLATGRFSWNGGIFVFQAGTMLEELRRYQPDLISALESEGLDAYANLQKISIDYAVMEKTERAYVLPVAFNWDDLGDWNALARLVKGDGDDNVALGRHLGLATNGSIFYATDEKEVIVTIGVENLVVVREGNVTLIVDKGRSQEIKQVLKLLAENEEYRELL